MLKQILDGEKPSAIFRRMLAEGKVKSKNELSAVFHEQLPGLGVPLSQLIWHWKGLEESGLPDEYVDAQIRAMLWDKGQIS